LSQILQGYFQSVGQVQVVFERERVDVNVKLKMDNYGGGEIPKSGGEKSPPQ
jgi:hypothetical protein